MLQIFILWANWKSNDSLKNIVLRQESSSSRLTITRIVGLSALYDLVLFETKENVANYLNIAEYQAQSDDELFIFGYPQGRFQKLKKTGKLSDDPHYYSFTVNHSYLAGASGSPVLDGQGRVIGITSKASINILFAIKANDLESLIEKNIGLDCSDFIELAMCFEEEQGNLKKLAEQGNTQAQYMLAMMYYLGEGIEKDHGIAFEWLKKSAEQEYAPAQYNVAAMYYKGIGVAQDYEKAFDWYKKSAEQGNALAQYYLATMYYKGIGVAQDDKLAFYWFLESAFQGYVPALKNYRNTSKGTIEF